MMLNLVMTRLKLSSRALSAGINFLHPYLDNDTHGHGVNFAVAGSTALPVEILAENGVIVPITNGSFSHQLDWMFTYFNGKCRNDEGFQSDDSTAYDRFHRLKDLNTLSIHHNNLLKQAIKELRQEFPNIIIVYGDYYNAYMELLRKVKLLGFDTKSTQKACCGIGGDYNFNLTKLCGAPGVPVCPNPDQYLSWGGIHLTQRAYMFMTETLLHYVYPQLLCRA
ncbi:hypothetical protein PTKIN_Ptkin05aG0084000 [Pterospermum kingtungense]